MYSIDRNKYQTSLQQLIAKINAKSHPIVVVVQPENGAKINECFNNVAQKITRNGGSACYGWVIWMSKYMIEAEKHAVWKSPNGIYVDVTPRTLPLAQIDFVIDSDFNYTGQWVDNARLNTTDNKVVDDWISICETIAKLYDYGVRSGETEIKIPEAIIKVILGLENFKKNYEPYLDHGGKYNGICFCGRSLPYKDCHGFELKLALSDILKKAAELYPTPVAANSQLK